MTENEKFVRAVAALIAKCDDKAKLFFVAHQTLEAMQAMDAAARTNLSPPAMQAQQRG